MTFFSFFKRHGNRDLFPARKDILVDISSKFDNFFPIATLDLTKKGIKDKIHVVYVSFDPAIEDSTLFPKSDNIDEFTFIITDDGKLNPTFSDNALTVSSKFKEYFAKAKKQYSKAKKEVKTIDEIFDFPNEPLWIQYDQTPANSKGQLYKFICELDVQLLVADDCKMFVFYDELDRKIKCIYQRT